MDALLSDELREATDELLNITPARPSAFHRSPHLQQLNRLSAGKPATASAPRLPTFSSSSKLEVLYSPTDVRPWQWPVPPTTSASNSAQATAGPSVVASKVSPQPIKVDINTDLHDDADDNLPSRGLSSRVHSVKAATGQEYDEIQLSASSPYEGDQERTAASPSKLRVRTSINDLYINQYGERVARGKVVGRILGGRPRPPSWDEDSSHQNNGALSSSQSVQQAVTQPLPSKRSMQASAASSPPAFFLESFPDAFTAEPSMFTTGSPSGRKKERRPSKGGSPSFIKAPRAVAGALTLDNTEIFEDARLLPDASFETASDFGSSSSSSSKPFSSRLQIARSFSASDSADERISTDLHGLQLQNVEQAKNPMESNESGLLSPSNGVQSTDTARRKIELPSFRRSTPTIGLSQARADPVVLHGNKRQARASGVVQAYGEASNDHGSGGNQPAVPPPAMTAALPTGRGEFSSDRAETHCRLASASEPSSPLLSPRLARVQQGDRTDVAIRLGEAGEQADDEDEDNDDKASLESAPSSLISLPVSTLTSSSRSPSHHSLERRRSSTGSMLSHMRRRSSSTIMHQSCSDIFAREVRIRGWSEVGSQARGWVVFELRIITKQGTPIVAHKRFSSFVKLRSSLLKECKDQAKWLPELPTRRTGLLSKYDAKYLEKRRRALQRWLEVVALDKVWGASEALREWVLASD